MAELIALTRGVSPAIGNCELEHLTREVIDLEKCVAQHREYERCLEDLGARVISLPADPDAPDCVFVEDPAVVLDEIAVICRMGAASRRREWGAIADALARFRQLMWILDPGTIEGGDVMRVGRTLYVGLSRRTNREGIEQLAEIVGKAGYGVIAVPVTGCLHLKSAVCSLGDNTLIANRAWIDMSALDGFKVIDVPREEPAAANVLRLGETVLVPQSFPRTRESLERAGFRVRSIDISELQKAEAGLTCSSLLFNG